MERTLCSGWKYPKLNSSLTDRPSRASPVFLGDIVNTQFHVIYLLFATYFIFACSPSLVTLISSAGCCKGLIWYFVIYLPLAICSFAFA